MATYMTPFITFFPYCGAWSLATQFGATHNVFWENHEMQSSSDLEMSNALVKWLFTVLSTLVKSHRKS